MELRFADCILDPVRHRLTRAGDLVHVEPQVFALIQLLAERNGDLVSRDEIIEHVWQGRIVSDATISARINAARTAVGDTGQVQAVIRTVTRKGLQLAVPVERGDTAPDVPVIAAEVPPAETSPRARRVAVRMAFAPDGSAIAWAKSGEGPPLLRGGHWLTHLERDVTSPIWAPWLERLGRGRTLVRYDARGTGLSASDCGPLNLETFVDDMLAVADAAGLDRFPVMATSQSAAVAFALAARHPDRVTRIFSYGGFPEGTRVRDTSLGDSMADAIGLMIRLGWGQPDGGQMRAFSSFMMPGARREQVAEFVELQTNSATVDRAVEMREALSRFDVKDILPEVKCPVCVVHSQKDAMHPFSQAQILMRLLPDARLHTLDSVNHLLLPDEPAFTEMMDTLDAFLAGELD